VKPVWKQSHQLALLGIMGPPSNPPHHHSAVMLEEFEEGPKLGPP